MKRAVSAALGIIIWSMTLSASTDPSLLYDSATLQYWNARYQRTTTKILNEVIWPALLTGEKNQLGGRKPVLEFPTYGEGALRYHALGFYAPGDREAIVFPVLSLKLLDDLCTAYAWLQIKGYSLETISEYTAILKYGKAPPTGFPAPLRALGIPANALDNPEVDELALGHFVTARTFLLLHEMAHILYHHAAQTSAQSIQNETQADRFAAVVMKRIGLPPLGILVFFMADAHWSGFPASDVDTHPLTGARVRALADHVDNPGLAEKLRLFGQYLDDPEIRTGLVATGKAGDLAALAPRRAGELPLRQVESRPASREGLFNGVYHGEFVQFSDPRPTPIEFVLERNGGQVTGEFSFGLGVGMITNGNIRDGRLYFDWQWASNYGQAMFEALADGSVKGTWGYREARTGAGTWTGSRRPR